MMLIALVGRKGRGCEEAAEILKRKYHMKILGEEQALKMKNFHRGHYVLAGVSSRKNLRELVEKGASVWLVRFEEDPPHYRGLPIHIQVVNTRDPQDFEKAVSQKLWGCC